MHKKIAMFNHKGGVSKTTTTFNIGWMLAERGHRVILVDTDPQCNLTGLILDYRGEDEFEGFYEADPKNNIRGGLAPAFESQPRPIEPVDCVEVPGREGLLLLPGHIRISEYEVTLGISHELSSSIQTLQNLPGSISTLLDKTAIKHEADFVLIDMNPSLSSFNQNLLATSDYFIVPTAPDYFSLMALASLKNILPKWMTWARNAHANPILSDAAYPFPEPRAKFLGTIIQNYRPRLGAPSSGFKKWVDKILEATKSELVPDLEKQNMTLSEERYRAAGTFQNSYCLALIPDFNTLIARSQQARTPVYALSQDQLGSAGAVLQQDLEKQNEFHEIFSQICEEVEALASEYKYVSARKILRSCAANEEPHCAVSSR